MYQTFLPRFECLGLRLNESNTALRVGKNIVACYLLDQKFIGRLEEVIGL